MKFYPFFLTHVCLGFILSACHKQPISASRDVLSPVKVRHQQVAFKKHLLTEDVIGSVRARTRAVVEAQVSGRIRSMPIKLGQQVESGEILLSLEAPELHARLDQAQAVLGQTEKQHQRYQRLLQEEAVTRQEYEMMLGRYRVAQAAVREAETMVGYTEIRAPFTGLVTRKYVDMGDLANPGRPLLEMDGISNFQFEADLPEVLLKNIKVGDRLQVSIDSLAKDFQADVSEIAPAAETSSRTFPIKLNLPPVEGLRAGQFGRAAVPIKKVEILLVPLSALVRKGQLEMVYVVNQTENQPRAEMRLIKTGKHMSDAVEVLSGLRSGETIVVQESGALRDWQPLDLVP